MHDATSSDEQVYTVSDQSTANIIIIIIIIIILFSLKLKYYIFILLFHHP